MAAKENFCVPGCGSQNQILHKFPHSEKDPDRFRAWLYAVGGEILSLENKYVFVFATCILKLDIIPGAKDLLAMLFLHFIFQDSLLTEDL